MAASRVSAPGSALGPCELPCKHRDCAASRADAAQLCRFCGGPIAYGIPFYRFAVEDGGFVHAACFEAAEEARCDPARVADVVNPGQEQCERCKLHCPGTDRCPLG